MKLILLYSTLISLFLFSCGSHYGTLSSDFLGDEYHYVDQALGYSETSGLGVIGGMSKDAMVLEAKNNMMQNRPLQAGESYANFTVDFSSKAFLIFKRKCLVTADVVREKSMDESVYSELYNRKVLDRMDNRCFFEVDDTLRNNEGSYFIYKGMKSDDKILCSKVQIDKPNIIKIKSKPLENTYNTTRGSFGYGIGDTLIHERFNYIILGVGMSELLVTDLYKGETWQLNYADLNAKKE